MLKAIYGLKDAPRAWRKRLHEALCGYFLNQLQAEPEIYIRHEAIKDTPKPNTENPIVSRKIVKTTGLETVTTPNKFPKLDIILSAHVDDLKGGATPEGAKSFLEYLESHFGKCKADFHNFAHTGMEHERKPDGILCHQWIYIDTLRSLGLSAYKGKTEDETLVGDRTRDPLHHS